MSGVELVQKKMKHTKSGARAFRIVSRHDAHLHGVMTTRQIVTQDQSPWEMQAGAPVGEGIDFPRLATIHAESNAACIRT